MSDVRTKRWRIVLALGISLTLAGSYYAYRQWVRRNQPGILLITLDTTRADRIGAYGYARARTPVLDQLAREGVLFEHALSPAPLTLPVHASLMTGLYPPEHGLRTNGTGSLPGERTTLATLLQRAGYDTGAFVASFVLDRRFGLHRGFQKYDDDLVGAQPTQDAIHRYRDGRLVVDAALEWLGQKHSNPTFCWVHLYDPHAPYDGHVDQFGEAFQDSPYDGEIAYTDQQVGRLLDFIKHHPRTIVIVAGDHGEGLGEHLELQHGYTLYRSTQHVPLIVRDIAGSTPGTRIAEPVSLVDVFPTVTELLGLSSSEPISGRSLLSGLQGAPTTSRPCYGLTDDPYLQNGWSPLRSLTTGRWKYIRTTDPELYDLDADPAERSNLAKANPARVAEFEKQLRDLEAGMTLREAAAVHLSAAERRVLATLGYVGESAQPRSPEDRPLPDVKQMLPFNVATQAAIELLEAGKLDEAEAAFRKIVAESPEEHVQSRLHLGSVLEKRGKAKEAEEYYRKVLDRRPDDLNALFHLAGLFAETKRLDEANNIYERCISLDPESAQPHYNLGIAAALSGATDRAERHFEDAVQADPAFPGVWVALGTLRLRQGRTDDAMKAYESELAINPDSIEARTNLGVQRGKENRLDEAVRHLSEAVRLDPKTAEIRFNLGVCLALQEKHADAAAQFRKAIEFQPDIPGIRVSLGDALNKLKDTKGAEEAYREELKRHPDAVSALIRLGILLSDQKQSDEAIAVLERAVRLAPDNAAAAAELERVRRER